MTKRVVVTGLGIFSSLGKNQKEVLHSLLNEQSGIGFSQEYADLGFKSQVSGIMPKIDPQDYLDRKILRFMASASIYSAIALQEAITQANLTPEQISNERTGLIIGSGGASNRNVVESADILRTKGIRKIGPYRVPRTMGSTTSACLSTLFKIKGVNYSISSACSTSSHCIGAALEQIQLGKQDIVFAGGGEELDWSLSMLFDAMSALSSKHNDNPTSASRPFDKNRDGFVISGGGGALVLESLDHALARGANILAEITGYAATSDGFDMVAPSGQGAINCMNIAKKMSTGPIDYINSHGTSTPIGDIKELEAIKSVFSSEKPPIINSTKSLSGHALGAAGVHEAIYTLLMMQNNFICKSSNILDLADEAIDLPIALSQLKTTINRAMSNSFGFGGTNASLVFEKFTA